MLTPSEELEGIMYRHFGNSDHRNGVAELGHDRVFAQSGRLDALVALD